jgi:hypothetical protein
VVEEMASIHSYIEKFNVDKFNLRELVMGYLLIEREKKEVVMKDTKPNTVK